jgi:hypothetical protein
MPTHQPVPQRPAACANRCVTSAAELLTAFIGEKLTTRLLHDAWPVDFAGDTTSSRRKHEVATGCGLVSLKGRFPDDDLAEAGRRRR